MQGSWSLESRNKNSASLTMCNSFLLSFPVIIKTRATSLRCPRCNDHDHLFCFLPLSNQASLRLTAVFALAIKCNSKAFNSRHGWSSASKKPPRARFPAQRWPPLSRHAVRLSQRLWETRSSAEHVTCRLGQPVGTNQAGSHHSRMQTVPNVECQRTCLPEEGAVYFSVRTSDFSLFWRACTATDIEELLGIKT